jgi:MarR family transcriptional regulator, negative regulator of the multidrug operon emrRAB
VSDRDDRRLVNLIGALSLAVADSMTDATDAAADLTDAGPAALVVLHETGPGRSIDQLRQLVGLTHSGAVRLVDRLVSAGYVERGAGPDLRTVGLRLTRRGTAAALRIRTARAEVISAALDGLAGSDRDSLEGLCDALVANLTRQRLAARAQGETPPGGALCRLCDFTACGRPAGRCPAARTARD